MTNPIDDDEIEYAPNLRPVMAYEFDQYRSVGRTIGQVVVRDDPDYADSDLLINVNGDEVLRIELWRDQWGTYLTIKPGADTETKIGGATIAQEDGTRSFLDALILGLTELKKFSDFRTKPPTVTVDNNQAQTEWRNR